jgi:hypothetical protein
MAIHQTLDRPAARRSARWAAALAALVSQHRLFTSMLAAGALLRLAVWVTYRPAFLFSDDSYWYLGAASQHHLNPVRPWAYSAFLLPLLQLNSLIWVTAAQHLVGLGSATIAYALLRRLGLSSVWACAGAVPLLFDPLVLTLEQFVMAETLFVFLTVLALAVLLWTPSPGVRTAAIVGLLVAATALTRTVGMTTMLPALIYVAAGRRWRPVAALLVAFLVPMMLYATAFRAEFGQFGVTDADGRFLYGRVAPFANCDGLSLSSNERMLCPTPGERHSPNWYTWRSASPLNHLPPGVGVDHTARDFAIRVILHQPGDYLGTVWDGVAGFARPTRTYQPPGARVAEWTLPSAAGRPPLTAKKADAIHRYGGGWATLQTPADVLHAYQDRIYTPGPLLVLATLAGIAGALFGRAPPGRRRIRMACAVLWLAGVLQLLLPLMTVIFSYRYLEAALSILVPAGVLGARLLVLRCRAREQQPSEAPA